MRCDQTAGWHMSRDVVAAGEDRREVGHLRRWGRRVQMFLEKLSAGGAMEMTSADSK